MTFEEYLYAELAAGKIDFCFRASQGPHPAIYIHPMGKDGQTTVMCLVIGNTLVPDNPFSKADSITWSPND